MGSRNQIRWGPDRRTGRVKFRESYLDMLELVTICQQSIFSTLFARRQQRCGLWLPVWCALVFTYSPAMSFHAFCRSLSQPSWRHFMANSHRRRDATRPSRRRSRCKLVSRADKTVFIYSERVPLPNYLSAVNSSLESSRIRFVPPTVSRRTFRFVVHTKTSILMLKYYKTETTENFHACDFTFYTPWAIKRNQLVFVCNFVKNQRTLMRFSPLDLGMKDTRKGMNVIHLT